MNSLRPDTPSHPTLRPHSALTAVRPYADLLDLVSATAPEGIGRAWAYALATGAAGVVVMVVAVSAACSVFARLQVAHIHFFLGFVHVTFLHLLFGCVSRAE